MKTHLILLSLLFIPLCSCEKASAEGGLSQQKTITLTKSQSGILADGASFSFDLLRTTVRKNGMQNIFLSPLSLQTALSMTAAGAEGETRDEIYRTIGYLTDSAPDRTPDEINAFHKAMMEGLGEVDGSTVMETANSVWLMDYIHLKDNYVNTLEDCYDAAAGSISRNSSSIDRINAWCSDHTHGMIQEFFESPDQLCDMNLMNALYFKGVWSSKFEASSTFDQIFHTFGGEDTEVPMMHKAYKYRWGRSDGTEVCEIPYGNGAYVLDVILPDSGTDFPAFISDFTFRKWEGLLSAMNEVEVRLSLPKIKMEQTVDLTDILKTLGIRTAFTDAADFGLMAEESLCMSAVKQKTVLKMDEEGTEAAAVTHVGMELTCAGPGDEVVFTADHPFLYLIRETGTGAVLFVGIYCG